MNENARSDDPTETASPRPFPERQETPRITIDSMPHATAMYEASGYGEVSIQPARGSWLCVLTGDGVYVRLALSRALAALDEAERSRRGRSRGHGAA